MYSNVLGVDKLKYVRLKGGGTSKAYKSVKGGPKINEIERTYFLNDSFACLRLAKCQKCQFCRIEVAM